ncbi:MAG TPA: TonB-dependent receptor [Polyangia bacterium]|nr:TonB-dependent receptor [Polyangia bacterium]
MKKRPYVLVLALGSSTLGGFTLALLAAGSLLLAPRTAHAVGETTGRITGTVIDANTKKPLGGLEVSATSPALIGEPRSATVEDNGAFELPELPPGVYDVEIGFPGLKPLRRKVRVRQGENTPLNISWSPEIEKVQTYNVIEETHLTHPDTAKTGTVIGADTEARLATRRSYQNVLNQVAGVSYPTDPTQNTIPVIKGANRLQNRYLVDGLDITDSVTNNFSTQVNFDSIGSIEVITGGLEAQYNALGGVVNLITAPGSDKLHIDTSFYIQSGRFGVRNQYGSQVYENELPLSTAPGVNTQNYQANFNISGPLIKHKLWASIGLQYDRIESQLPIGPPLNVQHPARQQNNFFPRFKLTWAPTSKHRFTLSGNSDYAYVRNRDQSNGELPNVEYGQNQGGAFGVVQWDYFHSNSLSTQVQAGYNFNNLEQRPQGQFIGGIDPCPKPYTAADCAYDPDRPRHTNNFDGSIWGNGIPITIDRRHTWQFDVSVSKRGRAAGTHDAKFGIQTRFAYHNFFRHTPGDSFLTSNSGQPGLDGLCDPATGRNCNGATLTEAPEFSNNQFGAGVGAYAQDRWRITRRFVFLPGFRVDWGYTRNSLGQTVSSLVGFGPRFGFTFDLTGDSKTIFSAFYARANETLSLLPASRADVDAPQRRYVWDNTQQRFVFQSSSGGAAGYRLDGQHLNPPHDDEITLSLTREIFNNSIAAVNYTYKRISNIWDAVEVNQVWDPSGTRVVGYVNGQPERVFLYTRPDGNYRRYNSVDFIVESQPTKSWDIYAAYTLSFLEGPGSDTVGGTVGGGSAYANPRQYKFFQSGYLPEDQRHQFRARVSYTRSGFLFGVNMNYATGIPLSKLYFNATDGTFSIRRSPQGTDPAAPNSVGNIAAFRTPDTFVVNVRVAYDFNALIGQHLTAIVDLFNIFNIDTPTSLTTLDGINFGLANRGRQAPFRFQLGLRYLY